MEKTIRTKDDLMKCIANRLKEELIDVSVYNSLYEDFETVSMYAEADEIEEIAREEFTHANALYEILEEHGYDKLIDQEIMNLWYKAKSIFHIK
jgi:rubrerythrin